MWCGHTTCSHHSEQPGSSERSPETVFDQAWRAGKYFEEGTCAAFRCVTVFPKACILPGLLAYLSGCTPVCCACISSGGKRYRALG